MSHFVKCLGQRLFHATIIVCFLFTVHSPSLYGQTRGYQAECISYSSESIVLKLWSPVLNTKYSIEHARTDAIHALLFSGIFVGCSPRQPLLKGQPEQEAFKKIELEVFSKSGWWNSMTSRDALKEKEQEKLSGYSDLKFYFISVQYSQLIDRLVAASVIKP